MARKSNRNSEGTSFAVGVTLMVLIAVLLSAIIAAFSFDMVYSLNEQHNVGVRVARSDAQVIKIATLCCETGLLMSGGTDHSDAGQATYTCIDSTTGLPVNPCNADGSPATAFDASGVGSCMYFPVGFGGQITIVAHFTDWTATEVFSGKVL